MKVKDWGDRRWYVNGQGQTFAVIDGPVEFDMGSPPTEPERRDDGTPPQASDPPASCDRHQGGDRRAIQEVSTKPATMTATPQRAT